MKKHRFPKEIFVFVADVDRDGTPIYGVSTDIEGVPEDVSGQRIGRYEIASSPTFVVTRSAE